MMTSACRGRFGNGRLQARSPGASRLHKMWFQEPAAGTDYSAIDLDFSSLAKIANQVPVQRRVVFAPSGGVGNAQGHVAGASHFFIQQGHAGRPGDGVITAQADLAEYACSGVLGEQAAEEILPLGSAGFNYPARPKDQAHSLNHAAP